MNKSIVLILAFIAGAVTAIAQENMLTLSGGYAFANIEETDTDVSGWRINGLYEFNPSGGKMAHGISLGYISTEATVTTGLVTTDHKITSVPVYYAPKYMFGSGSFKGFIKGALGMHFSTYERTGTAGIITSTYSGFYGGLSPGIMLSVSDKLFLNAEFEWAYMSNSSYRDGFISSAMLGLGFKF